MISNVSPILFSLGPVTVRWYGALFALAFYLGFKMMNWIVRRENLKIENVDSILFYIIVGTVVGARLGHTLIYEPEIYLHDPIRILKVWEGGLASHGGAVGVVIALWLWKRKFFPTGTYLQLLDYLCIPATLAGAMIRLGNFFNSEIVGRPTTVPWAITFAKIDQQPRHPTMLYESFSYFVIFGLMILIFKKNWHRGRVGLLTGFYFVTTFTARFFLEFLKEFQVPSEANLPLDLGQLLSIPFVIGGVILIVRALRAHDFQTHQPLETASGVTKKKTKKRK
jgi:phosphatidylglycerol:prolipoprotein diacylglycerol transferase